MDDAPRTESEASRREEERSDDGAEARGNTNLLLEIASTTMKWLPASNFHTMTSS